MQELPLTQANGFGRIYSIDELMEMGFSRRSISYYIQRGLLPHAHGRGRTAFYSEVHVKALRAISRAKDTHVTLGDVRDSIQMAKERWGRVEPRSNGSRIEGEPVHPCGEESGRNDPDLQLQPGTVDEEMAVPGPNGIERGPGTTSTDDTGITIAIIGVSS